MTPENSQTPLYLVAELTVHDRDKLVRYGQEVQPIMARHGGRILGLSLPSPTVVEGDRRPDLIVIHRWESRQRFEEFWRSPEYAPVRQLRHEACDSEVFVLDGIPE